MRARRTRIHAKEPKERRTPGSKENGRRYLRRSHLERSGPLKRGVSSGKSKGEVPAHWCLKSIKSGFAIAIVANLKNLDVLSQRIDARKFTHGTLQDTKENVLPEAYSGLQT